MSIVLALRWSLLVAALFTTPAMAEYRNQAGSTENSWSIGIGVGLTDLDDVCEHVEDRSCNRDVGWKFYIATDVTRHFALEVSWTELIGERGETFLLPGDERFETEVEGPTIALMPMAQLSKSARIFGKIGWYMWDLTATTTRFDQSTLEVESFGSNDGGTDLFLGLGVRFALGKGDLRLEWEQFEVDGQDVPFVSGSYEYMF